jgi:hypothetical protein
MTARVRQLEEELLARSELVNDFAGRTSALTSRLQAAVSDAITWRDEMIRLRLELSAIRS